MDFSQRLVGLSEAARVRFQAEFAERQKNGTVGVLMALFLGGFGAHRYYMGQVGLGVAYTLLFWTLIPGLIALVEMFLMPRRVRAFNSKLANEIVDELEAAA